MDIQKAGNNSTQVQASVINVYNGITEARAREIYQEEFEKIKELTKEAKQTAFQRVGELENRVIPKLSKIDKGLELFSNPDFQFLLLEAQKSAARSERSADYDLLTELLIHRVKNNSNREKMLAIKKAVEIVDSISDEALLGLTVLHSVSSFTPTAGNMESGLDSLDELFGKIIYDELPQGEHWLDHLDILGTIRINAISSLKPICDFYSERLEGYVCTGISKKSEDYQKALQIIADIKSSDNILVDHILNPGFVRINIPDRYSLNSSSKEITTTISLSEHEKSLLKDVFSLYDKDTNIIKNIKQRFSEEWDKRPNLLLLKNWWGNIPNGVAITEVGKVLAHANAQRCDNSLPSMD